MPGLGEGGEGEALRKADNNVGQYRIKNFRTLLREEGGGVELHSKNQHANVERPHMCSSTVIKVPNDSIL